MRRVPAMLLALLLRAVPCLAACPDLPAGPLQPLPIEVVGNSATDEGRELPWVAVLRERPVADSADGYKPHVPAGVTDPSPLPVKYECPLEFRWNFGDGTGLISTGERPSITHEYPDSGDFTLRVEAWSQGRVFASGTKVVKVRNVAPSFPRVAAVEMDPATNTFELTALATDVPGDPLTYEWDFGDGQTLATDEWRVEHAYLQPGQYTVKVRFRDDHGASREGERKIVVTGAAAAGKDTVQPLDQQPTGAVQTSINLTVDGRFSFTFTGEIRPVAGIHLAPRKPAGGCRFMFSAWDNANLAHLAFIVDLKGIREGGAIYTFDKPGVWLNLEAADRAYARNKSLMTGAHVIGPAGIGSMLQGLPNVADLTVDQRRAIANQAGVEPSASQPGDPVPVAASSPFGLDDHEGFRTEEGQAGLLFIPHDRAVGRLEVKVRNSDRKSPYQTMLVHGDFALDLESARRDGVLLYDACGPADLQIEKVSPDDGETFLYGRTPNVSVYFSDRYAADSLNGETFQLTYPAPGLGEPVPVPVKLFRNEKSAWIRPTTDLLGGVRYTARVKVGEGGVLDRGGNPIPDENGTGWYTWSFTTRPDFIPDGNSPAGGENISCHVFQTVRDAPLIAGKPALARIHADWRRHPEVHHDAQIEEFTARVALTEGGADTVTETVRFVRRDLWASRGIDPSKAQHTANLFFTPRANLPKSLRVRFEMPKDPGDAVAPTQWTSCSTPIWKLSPKVTVQWYIVNVNQWNEVDVDTAVKPWVERVIEQSRVLATQLFPVSSVEMRFAGVMPYPPMIPDRRKGIHLNCDDKCVDEWVSPYWPTHSVQAAVAGLDYDPSATMTILIMPAREADSVAGVTEISGGGAKQRVGIDGPAKIIFAFEDNPAYFDRYVFGLVHEMGHALWLEHLPYIDDTSAVDARFSQAATKDVRDAAWANNDKAAFQYAGIEGFLVATDGQGGKNKSSTEGNEESGWLSTLMYPSSMLVKDIFIARHHYLQLMRTWEQNGGVSKP